MEGAWFYGGAASEDRRAGLLPPHRPGTRAPGNPSISPLPKREVFAQGAIERAISDEQMVIHARAARAVLQLGDMRLNLGTVFVLAILRGHFQAFLGFHVDEQYRLIELRF